MTDEQPHRPLEQMGPYERSLYEMQRARREAEQRQRSARRRTVVVATILPLVLALSAGGWWLSKNVFGTSTPSSAQAASADCPKRASLELWAAPDVAPVVSTAAQAFTKASLPCTDIKVTPMTGAAAISALDTDPAKHPQGWVIDAPYWAERVPSAAKLNPVALSPFARSPLVIATAPEQAARLKGADWITLTTGKQAVVLSDPRTTTEGMLALTAAMPSLEANADGGTTITALAARQVATTAELFERYRTNPSTAAAFPASELSVFAYNRANPDHQLTEVAPGAGTPALEYSVVDLAGGSADSVTVHAFSTWLSSPAAGPTLLGMGLRPSTTSTSAPSGALEDIAMLQSPSSGAVQAAADRWQSATLDFSMIVAVDVSDSMAATSGGTSRIGYLRQSGISALSTFPATTKLGLWVFASDKGPNHAPWLEVSPLAPLTDMSHKLDLVSQVQQLERHAGGRTGLYDTIWAGYQRLQETYDPKRVNALVVITDGGNDVSGGLSLKQLLTNIEQSDPDKPVAVTTIGLGPDVDAISLDTISRLAHSRYYPVVNPGDLTAVLATSLLDHRCKDGVCA